jgi:Fe-S-cluster-containing dehydrogenase component
LSHVEFDKDKCTDCRMCMQVCSTNKLGRVTPAAACIQIDRERSKYYGDMGCRVCDMTHERACVDACPVEALVYEPDLDVVRFDAELCTECLACLDVCPNVARDVKSGRIMICDLCDGDPLCVKWCPEGALSWGAEA